MTISRLGSLTAPDAAAVRRLATAAEAVDGVSALNEATLLRLQRPADHLLMCEASELLAYARVAGGTAELVVHPEARGAGRGGRVLTELLAGAERPVSIWAHGDLPAAAALARSHGLTRSRELWRLRRVLDDTLPAAEWPSGVQVRTYRPGADDAAWLALNARAFADHPEQGTLEQTDLQARLEADWFDPAGFFLAERDGALVGFHWTKVHPDPPVGEVYVLGVAPTAQGSGLGRALTLHGLAHLRTAGLREAMLYVEADNAAAVGMYERLGFTRAAVDVAYTAG